LQNFIKLGNDVGFAYQSPPPLYFSSAISCEKEETETNSNKRKIFFIGLYLASRLTFIKSLPCYFDEGEIFTSSSTKIGDFLDRVSNGDFSFVEMTKLADY
jgi:hypothetical protein